MPCIHAHVGPTRDRVWDLESGDCKSTLHGHRIGVMSVAISPDGKTIVSGSLDNTVRCAGAAFLPFHAAAMLSLTIKNPGWKLTRNCLTHGRVWDLESGECRSTLQGHDNGVMSVTISPDGKTIVSGACDKTVRCAGSPFLLLYVAAVLCLATSNPGWELTQKLSYTRLDMGSQV